MADLFENMFEERTCMPIETLMIETNEWHSHLNKTDLFCILRCLKFDFMYIKYF